MICTRQRVVHELFAEVALAHGDRVALVSGDERVSYGELNGRANRLAHYLHARGVGPGSRVGLHLGRSSELIVAMLAVLKAGGAYVPLDPEYPSERLLYMLEDAGVGVLVSDEQGLSGLPGFELGLVEVVSVDGEAGEIAAETETDPAWRVGGEELAYVMYTSGSTGQPKGVAVPHRAIVRLISDSDYCPVRESDCVAQASNACFDAMTFEVYAALTNGARLQLLSKEVMLSPPHLHQELQRGGVTILFVTTALFNQYAMSDTRPLRGLRQVLFGGQQANPRCVAQALARGGARRLLHVYGPTEATTFSTWHQVEELEPDADTVPIGRSLSNGRSYVLDEALHPVPLGTPGELYLGGDGVAHGYWCRSRLTAECFVPDPYAGVSGARMYRTGDRVRQRCDGALEFIGRTDDQVKVRGFRVEPGEVEAALLQHPAVRMAAVVAYGEIDIQLAAYFVVRPDAPATGDELKAWLHTRVPQFMVPHTIEAIDALPLNSVGKVDRPALPKPAGVTLTAAQHSAPMTTEDSVAKIFAETLRLERVGVETNFFDAGGDSLKAMQLVTRIRDRIDPSFSVRALYDGPRVGDIAARLSDSAAADHVGKSSIVVSSRARSIPATFAQKRLSFLNQLAPGKAAHHIPLTVRLRGYIDPDVFGGAANDLVKRHETLRTTFTVDKDELYLNVNPDMAADWGVERIEGPTSARRVAKADALIEAQCARPIDLQHGPLVRIRLYRIGPDDHLLLLLAHHMTVDGWSMDVLLADLLEFYDSTINKRTPILPALHLQYADFAAWQRDSGRPKLEQGLHYWKNHLANMPATLDLPIDFSRQSERSHEAGVVPCRIPASTSEELLKLAECHGCTPYMAFLSVFQILLSRYSDEDRVVVGSLFANRAQEGFEDVAGMFVNTVALAVDLSGNPNFLECLSRVRTTVLGAYDHQDVPFEQVVEVLGGQRSLTANPVFQVGYTMTAGRDREPEKESGLEISAHTPPTMDAKLDLTLAISNGSEATIEYDRGLFRESTIRAMANHFRLLAEGLVANPETAVSHIRLLSGDEWALCIERFNALAGSTRDVLELFEECVQISPAETAVVYGDQCLTYLQLHGQSANLARTLRQRGVEREARVAIYLSRSPRVIVATLGILRAGGAYVPIDIDQPMARQMHILQDASPAVIITEKEIGDALSSSDFNLLFWEQEEALPQASAPQIQPSGTADDAAYVIYTSGSTGMPKGTVIHRRGLSNLIQAHSANIAVTTASRVLHLAPFSFDAATCHLLIALCSGAALVLADRRLIANAGGLAGFMEHMAITHAPLPAQALVGLDKVQPSQLQVITVGGDICPPDLIRYWASRCKVFNAYGPTEATVCATLSRCSANATTIGIGNPIAGVSVYVLDRHMEPLPAGFVGELHIGGAGVARGYLGNTRLTAERFVPDPFAEQPGVRLYKSGDMARLQQDGRLEFFGRADRQVKLNGFRVELAEIEKALRRAPSVRDAAVLISGETRSTRCLVAVVSAADRADTRKVELWPSIAEYGVADELMYEAMLADEERLGAFRTAIQRNVYGSIVLEIGPGPEVVLGRACIDAGAKHVYAVERDPHAARQAQQKVRDLGLDSRITIVRGDVSSVDLPAGINCCVSSMVGPIGSSQGAEGVLAAVRRRIAPGARMIPGRAITKFAATSLPAETVNWSFGPTAARYVHRIFEREGRAFDLTLCVTNVGRHDLLSNAAVMETLDFRQDISREEYTTATMTIRRSGYITGFLVWVDIELDWQTRFSLLDNNSALLPVYVPAWVTGQPATVGDSLEVTIARSASADRPAAAFQISGRHSGENCNDSYFDLKIDPYTPAFKDSDFYARLFADGIPERTTHIDREAVQNFIQTELPEYMRPTAVVLLDALPTTSTGKIDYLNLQKHPMVSARAIRKMPTSPLEHVLLDIWHDLLGVDSIGVEDSFFDVGGHSLLATQLVARIRDILRIELQLSAVFENQTVATLARRIASDPATSQKAQRVARVVYEVNQLSDDQVALRLADVTSRGPIENTDFGQVRPTS